MAENKILACVGLNGFDRARLRLLLGEAGKQLEATWKLGSPEAADLLLLAAGSAEAAAAGLLARGRGVRCVILGEDPSGAAITLPPGFDVDDLVRVLTEASAQDDAFHSLDATSPEFFDTGTAAPAGPDGLPELPGAAADIGGVPEAVDLERFFRRDSEEYSLDRIVPHVLQPDAGVAPVERERASQRAEVRGSERNPYAPRTPQSPEAPAFRVEDAAPVRAGASSEGRPLGDYLDGRRLMAPSQLVMPSAEPLILDPKNGVYMIVGDLKSVEPYARAAFTDADFERLTTRELERWRALCEPRPFLRLHWLQALRRGDGWLPRHLDPGGSYRVRRELDLDAHFDAQVRITEALRDWRALHEVAARAGVDMQVVFNTVAAYDAIGWLESQPRQRFRR